MLIKKQNISINIENTVLIEDTLYFKNLFSRIEIENNGICGYYIIIYLDGYYIPIFLESAYKILIDIEELKKNSLLLDKQKIINCIKNEKGVSCRYIGSEYSQKTNIYKKLRIEFYPEVLIMPDDKVVISKTLSRKSDKDCITVNLVNEEKRIIYNKNDICINKFSQKFINDNFILSVNNKKFNTIYYKKKPSFFIKANNSLVTKEIAYYNTLNDVDNIYYLEGDDFFYDFNIKYNSLPIFKKAVKIF